MAWNWHWSWWDLNGEISCMSNPIISYASPCFAASSCWKLCMPVRISHHISELRGAQACMVNSTTWVTWIADKVIARLAPLIRAEEKENYREGKFKHEKISCSEPTTQSSRKSRAAAMMCGKSRVSNANTITNSSHKSKGHTHGHRWHQEPISRCFTMQRSTKRAAGSPIKRPGVKNSELISKRRSSCDTEPCLVLLYASP